jgi:undecaprenyl-diphosphatase
MNFLHVVILSLVEGLTEFLPISSTGHMILASKLLGIAETDFLKTFEIVIQLGAIGAVVVLYFNKFWKSLTTNFDLIKKLIVAFIPTAIVGFTLYPLIKNVLLGSSAITLWALFIGGVVLIMIEYFLRKKTINHKAYGIQPSYRQAFIIGTFQSLSVIPGVSRAAATIVGGLLSGLDRPTATEFSFLLAVPTMVAATGLDLFKSRNTLLSGNISMLVLGTVLSFIFAIFAVKFLINFVKKHDFTAFGIYRIILAILFWIFVK